MYTQDDCSLCVLPVPLLKELSQKFLQTSGDNRTIILSTVLYECETWSFRLREESDLRVFDNRVLRKVLGPKRDEVTGA